MAFAVGRKGNDFRRFSRWFRGILWLENFLEAILSDSAALQRGDFRLSLSPPPPSCGIFFLEVGRDDRIHQRCTFLRPFTATALDLGTREQIKENPTKALKRIRYERSAFIRCGRCEFTTWVRFLCEARCSEIRTLVYSYSLPSCSWVCMFLFSGTEFERALARHFVGKVEVPQRTSWTHVGYRNRILNLRYVSQYPLLETKSVCLLFVKSTSFFIQCLQLKIYPAWLQVCFGVWNRKENSEFNCECYTLRCCSCDS